MPVNYHTTDPVCRTLCYHPRHISRSVASLLSTVFSTEARLGALPLGFIVWMGIPKGHCSSLDGARWCDI